MQKKAIHAISRCKQALTFINLYADDNNNTHQIILIICYLIKQMKENIRFTVPANVKLKQFIILNANCK